MVVTLSALGGYDEASTWGIHDSRNCLPIGVALAESAYFSETYEVGSSLDQRLVTVDLNDGTRSVLLDGEGSRPEAPRPSRKAVNLDDAKRHRRDFAPAPTRMPQ